MPRFEKVKVSYKCPSESKANMSINKHPPSDIVCNKVSMSHRASSIARYNRSANLGNASSVSSVRGTNHEENPVHAVCKLKVTEQRYQKGKEMDNTGKMKRAEEKMLVESLEKGTQEKFDDKEDSKLRLDSSSTRIVSNNGKKTGVRFPFKRTAVVRPSSGLGPEKRKNAITEATKKGVVLQFIPSCPKGLESSKGLSSAGLKMESMAEKETVVIPITGEVGFGYSGVAALGVTSDRNRAKTMLMMNRTRREYEIRRNSSEGRAAKTRFKGGGIGACPGKAGRKTERDVEFENFDNLPERDVGRDNKYNDLDDEDVRSAQRSPWEDCAANGENVDVDEKDAIGQRNKDDMTKRVYICIGCQKGQSSECVLLSPGWNGSSSCHDDWDFASWLLPSYTIGDIINEHLKRKEWIMKWNKV